MGSRQYIAMLCIFVIKQAVSQTPQLTRHIDKTGYHREIVSHVDIPSTFLPDIDPGGDIPCYILFIETIPSGAFVDPYQINSLKPFGGPDVLILDKVDLEKAEFESEEITVFVFSNLSHSHNTWSANYSLPVHLRYHAISTDAPYAPVIFNNPDVAIRCEDKRGMQYFGYKGETLTVDKLPCTSDSPLVCEWTHLAVEKTVGQLTVQVPVGKTDHYLPVTIVTAATITVGCLLLIVKAVQTNTGKHWKVS